MPKMTLITFVLGVFPMVRQQKKFNGTFVDDYPLENADILKNTFIILITFEKLSF